MITNGLHECNAITHYAWYGDLYGTAELLNGSGYLFRAEGERKATLVSYKDPALMLLGNVAIATTQHAADGNLLALVERRNTEQARGKHEGRAA